MMMREILVIGASGQLGMELRRAAWPGGWRVIALDRRLLDLADTEAIAATIGGRSWSAVINGAAYTAVDMAENNQVEAWRINALAPAAIAAACAAHDIPLIQVSTDYVFAGDRDRPWNVDDAPAPLGVYGASKFGGELAVRASGARHVIVRTAWLVSPHGHNFLKTMLRLARTEGVVRVIDDQRGAPTSAADLAQAVATIAMRMADDRDAPTGIFHFSNDGVTTWASFAREIFRQSGIRGGTTAKVEGITTADYPTLAQRPANSQLSLEAINAAFGIAPRAWQEALSDILDELLGVTK